MTQKYTITNRHGLDLVIQIDQTVENPSKLVFIAHGQKGTMRQPHIEAFARAFLSNNYRVVRFDATHSVGESGGDFEDVTYDTYVSDLEDVIEWARTQEWYGVPFALCGHSMGAQSITWYSEHNPENVSLLAPMAPVINFELHTKTYEQYELEDWRTKGYKEVTTSVLPNRTFRLKWKVEESLKQFDILPLAKKLTMPVLNIVGGDDKPCPPSHQKIFMDRVASNQKELIVLDGLEHSYRNSATNQIDGSLEKLELRMTEWIKTISQVPDSRVVN